MFSYIIMSVHAHVGCRSKGSWQINSSWYPPRYSGVVLTAPVQTYAANYPPYSQQDPTYKMLVHLISLPCFCYQLNWAVGSLGCC